jgi:hypothetical protein
MGSVAENKIVDLGGSCIQANLIKLALVLTPFLSAFEVFEMFGFDSGLLWFDIRLLKVSKDVVLLGAIVTGFLYGYFNKAPISGVSLLYVVLTVFVSVMATIWSLDFEPILAGLRWLLPLMLCMTIKKYSDSFYRELTLLLFYLFLIGLGLQLFQYFFMDGRYGLSVLGFNLRSPGFYLIPSSMAAFSMTTLYFVYSVDSLKHLKMITFFLVGLSIFLTASGTGYVSYLLFLFFSFGSQRTLLIRFIVACFCAIFLFTMLPDLTDRRDILSSPMSRIEIFFDHFSVLKILFSDNFGVGTNTFVSLQPDLLDSDKIIIADSSVTSSFINLGLFAAIFIFYQFFIRPFRVFDKETLRYLTTFLPFFLTVIVFELFPINILMVIAMSKIILSSNRIRMV